MDVGATGPAILAQLQGFVDYAPIPLSVEVERTKRFVVGTIPKRHYTRLAVFTLLLGRDGGDGPDGQWLGFQFYSLGVG